MQSQEQSRRKVTRQLDTGYDLAATSRPTLRSSCSVPGISNKGATSAWPKENTGVPTRPKARVSVEQIDGRPLTSTPRASLRSPALTQSNAKVRHYGTPSLSSVTSPLERAGPGVKTIRHEYPTQLVTEGSQMSYISKASVKASFGNVGPSARTKRTDSMNGAARYAEDTSSNSYRSVVGKMPSDGKAELDRTNENDETRSLVCPTSPARTGVAKGHLQIEQITRTSGSILAERVPVLPNLQTTGIPLDIDPNEADSLQLHVASRENFDLSASTERSPTSPMSAKEDVTVDSAAAEAKRDRKFEDLVITNRSLVTLNRQHEAEVMRKDRIITTLRRQIRNSGQLPQTSRSALLPAPQTDQKVASGADELSGMGDDLALEEYLDCVSKIEDCVARANAKLESMVNKGRQALSVIDDVRDGAKGRVLIVHEDDDRTSGSAESKNLPDG